jgi:thioredoxin-related protein
MGRLSKDGVMKKVLWALLLMSFVGIPCAVATPDSAINWLTFDEAQKLERTSEKKFFLYFYTNWCGYCRKLEQSTFIDPSITDYINGHFIPVRINSEKLPKIAARYKVGGVPDIRFIDSAGEDIARWPGYIDPKQLLPLLKYIHTDSYLRMGYTEFLKHN